MYHENKLTKEIQKKQEIGEIEKNSREILQIENDGKWTNEPHINTAN